eukprot:scaffold118103_cov26-Cyclotella_meneghiniana.AAC.3
MLIQDLFCRLKRTRFSAIDSIYWWPIVLDVSRNSNVGNSQLPHETHPSVPAKWGVTGGLRNAYGLGGRASRRGAGWDRGRRGRGHWRKAWWWGSTEGAALGVTKVCSDGIRDDKAQLLEGVFFRGGCCVGVAIEVFGVRLGGSPAGCGQGEDADGAGVGGGAVIHAGGVGLIGFEVGCLRELTGTEEKGVEHGTPPTIGAEC